MRFTSYFTGAALCLLLSATAHAEGPIPAPKLQLDQYVYTVPEGYSPPGVGPSGIESLNGQLKRLHYPFFVVFVDKLPNLTSEHQEDARQRGFRGDRDTLLVEYGTAMLAEDWAMTQGELQVPFNSSTDTVFVLSWQPRKFAWVPGGDRRARLGLEKGALKQFEGHFIRAVKSSPKDPVGGIANLANAFDNHVFEYTDPGRIAARKEAAERAAQAKRLATARGNLDEQIGRLATLLKADPDHLPDDVSSYKSLLAKARGVRTAEVPADMNQEAASMKPSVDVLDKHVEASQTKALWSLVGTSIQWAVIFGVFLFIFWWVRRRVASLASLGADFEEAYQGWADKLNHGQSRYVDFFLDRDDLIAMDDAVGKTKALRDTTTAEVDAIYLAIRAMEKHIEGCKAMASKANFFTFDPIRTALLDIDGTFTFDTGKINRNDLFGPPTETITVTPSDFADSLRRRYETCIAGWNDLKAAAEYRLQGAFEHFPHAGMDQIIERANKADVPEHWYADHPLAGEDEADKVVWEDTDELRWVDPVAYRDRIEELRAKQTEVQDRLDGIFAALHSVNQARVESLNIGDTVVDAEDDPVVTLDQARSGEAKLAGLLTGDDLQAVVNQANDVCDLYRKAKRQSAEIQAAVQGAAAAISTAEVAIATADKGLTEVISKVKAASKVHTNIGPANDHLTAGHRLLRSAMGHAKRSLELQDGLHHLDARRLADQATGEAKSAHKRSQEAEALCTKLDRDKVAFEKKLKQMGDIRSEHESTIRRHNGSTSRLGAFQAPNTGTDLLDYMALAAILNRQEREWEAASTQARREYEAEQARIRRKKAEEERRRRDEEAAARRRRSSYSSSSSSSSFGGGGFGGSSGSSGGGGFGGSSGSW